MKNGVSNKYRQGGCLVYSRWRINTIMRLNAFSWESWQVSTSIHYLMKHGSATTLQTRNCRLNCGFLRANLFRNGGYSEINQGFFRMQAELSTWTIHKEDERYTSPIMFIASTINILFSNMKTSFRKKIELERDLKDHPKSFFSDGLEKLEKLWRSVSSLKEIMLRNISSQNKVFFVCFVSSYWSVLV